MKLPKEIQDEIDDYGYYSRSRIHEAIVRDCAQICAENDLISGSLGPLFNAGWNAANNADANAILARYGLTEKEQQK